MARPVHHHRGTSSRTVGNCMVPLRHQYTYQCAGPYRRDHVHGRRDRQLDSGGQLRQRAV